MIHSPETASGVLTIKVEKSTLKEGKKNRHLLSSSTALDSGVAEFRPELKGTILKASGSSS